MHTPSSLHAFTISPAASMLAYARGSVPACVSACSWCSALVIPFLRVQTSEMRLPMRKHLRRRARAR
eukprot:4292039-Pleurochrysis_carterae.AAC.1